MGIIQTVINEIKATVGYQQDFEQLLQSQDVTRAINLMNCHANRAADNLKEYGIEGHKVMKREDRAVYDKKGNFLRWSKRWKLPIPYQQYINEVSLAFLYGRPPKFSQGSDGAESDYAFAEFKKLNDEVRFSTHIRTAKRAAGAEGTAAILYHVSRDKDGKPHLTLNTLCKGNGDELYTIFDQYHKLKAFAWGYYLTDKNSKTVQHIQVYTDESIYICKRELVGWSVERRENLVGKIPVLFFEQEPEDKEVRPLIERVEWLYSTDGDVNDRFSNPAMVASTDVVNNLPKQEEEAKLYILKNGGTLNYLTWDQASQSKENEYNRLDAQILNKTFTPHISAETMKAFGTMSAKAIHKTMFLAVMKADKHKEKHDEYLSRHSNIMLAILGNVLDYANRAKYEALIVNHEFQEPFGDDVSETLSDMLKQFGQGGMSRKTLVELSYLIKNPEQELERIAEEEQQAMERQKELNKVDVFGGGE